jgi:PPOX class probable F420-dependent enzyme
MTTAETIPQGDRRLLRDPIAEGLLNSTELAHLAYIAADGTPRVIPVGFLWKGHDLVMATFAGSPKVAALRANQAVALTIDRPGPPPEVLTIRGRVELQDVAGVPDEYREMQARYYGEEQAAAVVASLEQSGARMVRMVLRPSWVGLLDFQTRLPRAVDAQGAGRDTAGQAS